MKVVERSCGIARSSDTSQVDPEDHEEPGINHQKFSALITLRLGHLSDAFLQT